MVKGVRGEMVYAIIEMGGKQYAVERGSIVEIEKVDVPEGETLKIDKVLFLKKDDEGVFGTPYVKGATVQAKVLGHGKGKKIIVFKYKRKKNYRRKRGHRQPFTRIVVEDILMS